ncbi:MAG: Signal transduction histidine kinase [Bacteroidetes bacterium]|nr:MAG: Signal transduction histidine kinase [Bacteroidota bacterium]
MSLLAHDATLRAQQYNFQHYNVSDGLPQSQINCIYQDSYGFIWIGTDGGAARFDGKKFVVFDTDNGLLQNRVRGISETGQAILIASDSGICEVTGKAVHKIRFNPSSGIDKVRGFAKGAKDEILVMTNAGLWKYENGAISRLSLGSPVNILEVRTVYVDSKGILWVGTERNGLFRFQWQQGKYIIQPFASQSDLSVQKIRGVIEHERGELWVATSGEGLFSFDGSSYTRLQLPENENVAFFTSTCKDADENMWFGSWGGGLVQYKKSVFKSFSKNNGLYDDVISCLFADRDGNVWIGSFTSGVMVYAGQQFSMFTKASGLPDENIRSIVYDENSNVWMATLGGLARFDGIELTTITEKEGLSYNRIGALASDQKGKLYIGTLSGEINVLEKGKITVYKDREQLPAGEIISLAYGKDGSLWIGTVYAGLVRFRDNTFERVASGGLLEGNPIWALHEDTAGTLWLGTEKGILRMENGEPQKIKSKNKRTSPEIRINAITSDKDYIYFATYGTGVWRYELKKQALQFIDKKEGLSSNYTTGFLWLNNNKMLLVSTITGLDRVEFIGNMTTTFRHFGKADGLGNMEFSPGAMTLGRDGKVWLGTSSGAIIYDLAAEKRNKAKPLVVLRGLSMMNEKPDWTNYSDSISSKLNIPVNPEFPHDKNYLSFDFAAIQFGPGVNLRYQYKLEGYDADWGPPSESGLISYSNLPPGDYRLLVKAGNSAGAWSEPAVFAFRITPPFWKTWWFFLGMLLLIFLICLGLMLFYRRVKSEFMSKRETEYMLPTSRMILFFAATVYPLDCILCSLFDRTVNMQPVVACLIAVLLLGLAAGTYFYEYFRKNISLLMTVLFPLVVFHFLYLNKINQLSPVTVTALIISILALGIVVDSWRSLAVISGFVIIFGSWLGFSVDAPQYNPWLFVLGIITSLLIAFLALLVRHNMFNRLIFADTAINSSWSIVLAADKSGKIIFVSRSVRYLLGYTEDELMGDGWWKVRSDDQEENDRIKKNVIDMNSSQRQSSYITAVKTKNGKLRWIQWVDTMLESGVKVGIGQDVTDRREIEQRYRHIVEAANDIIYTTDFRGNFTYINEVGAKLTGYSREELNKMRFFDLLPASNREEVVRFYQRQFTKKAVSSYHEFMIHHKDGHEIWVGQTVRALFDEHRRGYIKGFQSIARDITEKKRYEEELEKLSLVASETINGVLISDPENRVEWANEGFTRITGYLLREIKGKRIGDLLAGEKTDLETIEVARRKTARGDGFIIELLVYHKDGREIWISISNTPIVDENGKMLKQIEIFTDITEKKAYEEQLSRYSIRLEILNRAKQDILQAQNMQEMTQSALYNLARRISYCNRLSMAIFDHSRGMADLYYIDMDNKNEMVQKEYALGDFRSLPYLRENKHMLVHDLEVEEILSGTDSENLSYGVRSYLIMPLYSQNELIGSINLGSSKTHAITDDDVQLVREVSDSMAIAVQQRRYQEIIMQKNKDISDSINYAQRIQEAILLPGDMLKQELNDAFVFYQPKDVLSGDFYWVEKWDKLTYVAVADCTGHGVPGALLSLMGNNLLYQSVQERHLNRPAAVLDYINTGIQKTLNQFKTAGEMLDGMDIALCIFDHEHNRLFYSGAVNPLWIVRDGVIIEVRGDRYSIGSYSETPFRFSNHEVELKAGDMIYLFSDGFADQFGGPNFKKYSYARLRDLLTRHAHLSTEEQKKIVEDAFVNWRNGNTQTDDVCVVGIKV